MERSHTAPFFIQSFARCLLKLPFCLFLLRVSPVESREFTLGFLVPYHHCNQNTFYCGSMYASGIVVALEEINSNPYLLAGHNLTYIWNDTNCDRITTVKQHLHQLSAGVDAFIGPACYCDTVARVAEAANKTMISYECTSLGPSMPRTFLRTIGSVDEQLTSSILSLLQHFNWTQVGIVYEGRDKYTQLKDLLSKNLPRKPKTVIELPRYFGDINETLVNETFQNVKDEANILIFVSSVMVSRPTIYWLQNLRLVCNDTVFIICQRDSIEFLDFNTISSSSGIHRLLKDYTDVRSDGNLTSENTKRLLRHLDSVFMIAVRPPEGKEYEKFTSEVKARIKKAPFYSKQYDDYENVPPPIQAASLYDAVNLYAIGLNMTLTQGKPLTGVNIANNIKSLGKFKSIQGFNMIMKNGVAQNEVRLYQIKNTKNISKIFSLVGIFEGTESKLNLDTEETITWPGGLKIPPKDQPCGRSGHPTIILPEKTNELVIIITVAVVMCVLLLLLILIYVRQYRLEKELKDQLWKISFGDLSFHFRKDSFSTQPCQTENGEELNPEWCKEGNKWTAVARYKSVGEQVVVSKFPARSISLTRNDHIDLKKMRNIRHKNLNPFVGACIESPHVCVVMHYCSRGSLQDNLENPDVSIDHLFITFLVTDIVKGMAYLHSTEIRSHGNLKSSNCLIDSHWVLKITDYGLPAFRSKAMKNKNVERPEDLFWVAPEILRLPIRPFQGTQKGDVYSFAIILQEFHTRKGPFSADRNLKPKDIIQRLKNCEEPPFRPTVPNCIEKDKNEELYKLMLDCWVEEPNLRPDFGEISKSVHKMVTNQGMKTNIVDNMVYMLSKYSDDLEGIVQKRTKQLYEEQKMTEALLEQMLPRPVAEQLKRNGNVEAESFNEVTIYFSDIVGFTSLSADSTPMQVVTMLNDLYLMLDAIIREYDVYKVETIGDAYMVVSGLPIRNCQKHASEISRMAFHLLAAVKSDFVVKHKPDYQLKLRIGIHSGPVVAGVVGSIMPRYCLFGDTVNMASRMESTGEALRIHVSWETKQILNSLGDFTLENRGEVEIKGKGKVETFWLTHARNLRSIVTKQKEDGGYLRQGSLLNHKRIGSLRCSLKRRLSPEMPCKLTLLDDQKKLQESHNHESPLHCELMIEENRLSPSVNRRELRDNGTAQEKQGLLVTMATSKL